LFRLYPHDIIDKIRLLEAVMQQVAQGLASLGRGDDKMLVHMTPREVQGLQSLAMAHGGSLTINPHTGLPEAGILDSLLPTVLGIGLSAATGLPAWGIGLGIGGATALASGDLRKGLMAGLGAFGGAGLGGGLSSLGGAEAVKDLAIEQTMSEAAKNAALEGTALPDWYTKELIGSQTALPSLSMTPAATAEERFANMGRGVTSAFENPSALGANVSQQLGGKYGVMAAAAPTVMAGLSALNKPSTVQGATPANKGTIRPYGYKPGDVNPNFGKPGEPYFLNQGFTAYPTYAAAAGGQVPSPSLPLDLSQNYPGSNITKSSYATLPSTDSQEVVDGYGPKINPFTGAEGMAGGGYINDKGNSTTFNSGGITASGEHYEFKDSPGILSRLFSGRTSYDGSGLGGNFGSFIGGLNAQGVFGDPRDQALKYAYNPDDQQYTEMASGGIASLPEYAAGGKLLRGPGDGMSDDIPAVIKGEKPQRAALADGEFVVPADVVSHLGNGSTEAGAKRLYSMMDRVRTARTGRKAQGKQINADRFVPA
jgi:hypothetical protein